MTAKATAKSLADFRAVHDKDFVIPTKIKAGLAKLGTDAWEYEPEFTKICGIGTNDMAKYRDQFADFTVATGRSADGKRDRRVWAGSKALANKLREMV